VKTEFDSRFSYGADFARDASEIDVKNEPMFFNASVKFAHGFGGPITRSFIEGLPEEFMSGVFDSRTHMLMPGWYPAIPGWHHDDVPRPEIPVGQHFITAGQPDYAHPRYRARHAMGLVNGEICPTAYAVGLAKMKPVPDGELIYRQWHYEIEEHLKSGALVKQSADSNRVLFFDCDAFHTGTKAIKSGWRWFGRVTIDSDRTKTMTNEFRKQSQVYLEFPMNGW
jgi:hypothetical protein